MKKLLALILTLAMLGCATLAFTACDTGATYQVGIIQLAQHDALDAATRGFQDALTEKLGDKVVFDLQNAQGEQNNCTTIVTKFVNNKVDLIMANATNAVVAAYEATETIPVVGTSVTDYVSAGLVASNEAPGSNVTGVSDMNSVANQMELIKAFAPNAQNIGIIICSAEENSRVQAEEAKTVFEAEGYTVNIYTANDATDLQQVANLAVSANDILYQPTDNLVAANMGIVSDVAVGAGKVIIGAEESLCKGGCVASYSLNYYDIGYQAGLQAYDILVNGKNPAEMPIKIFTPEELTLIVNEEVLAEMGITLPESLKGAAN